MRYVVIVLGMNVRSEEATSVNESLFKCADWSGQDVTFG